MNFADNCTRENLLVPYLVLKTIQNKTRIDWYGLVDRIFQLTGDVITKDHPLLKQYVVVEDAMVAGGDDLYVAYFNPELAVYAVGLCEALWNTIDELAKTIHIDARLLALLNDGVFFLSQIELAERELKEAEDNTAAFTLKFRSMVLHTLASDMLPRLISSSVKDNVEFINIVDGILNDISIDSSKR